MIEQIQIKGLGVIDNAVLEFAPGLTVLTGETGAGKTMVLTSLRLLMGEKSDAELVREGHGQTEVDGILVVPDDMVESLEEFGIAVGEEELIISRTVPKDGRTRALIGGRPVPLRSLSEVTAPLVTIHGQSDQWRVRRTHVQREMLDSFAGADLGRYHKAWREAVAAKKHLDELHVNFDQRQVEIQYLREVTSKISEFAPRPEEEETLKGDIERLANVADLHTEISLAVGRVQGGDDVDGAADLLGKAHDNLRRAAKFDGTLQGLGERIGAVVAEAQSIAEDLRVYLESLQDDPETLAQLLRRRADLESLLKGRASSATELLAWADEATERLEELTSGDANPDAAKETLEAAQAKVLKLGEELRRKRLKAAAALGKGVNAELEGLAMAAATFRVVVEQVKPGPMGLDEVSMELQAHPDAPFRPLGDGASGGELSRVMLALEVALGSRDSRSTYVFDEVDAGVGGRTAVEVGKRLAQLAQDQQVIVVTHLPQVAAFAQKHLVVEKVSGSTSVRSVQDDDRLAEIVRMMGGRDDSLAARRHALELLEANTWKNHQGRGA